MVKLVYILSRFLVKKYIYRLAKKILWLLFHEITTLRKVTVDISFLPRTFSLQRKGGIILFIMLLLIKYEIIVYIEYEVLNKYLSIMCYFSIYVKTIYFLMCIFYLQHILKGFSLRVKHARFAQSPPRYH